MAFQIFYGLEAPAYASIFVSAFQKVLVRASNDLVDRHSFFCLLNGDASKRQGEAGLLYEIGFAFSGAYEAGSENFISLKRKRYAGIIGETLCLSNP